MIKNTFMSALVVLSISASAAPVAPTNAPSAQTVISVKEMLTNGPAEMKLHSLSLISQGKIESKIDASFLPALRACSQDTVVPVRSITARIIGEKMIAGIDSPNPEAISILRALAKDSEADVRFSAVYYGLAQIKNKSPEIVEELIDVAASNRNLSERIAASLHNNKQQVIQIFDTKLESKNSIAYFELYEDFTGQKPADADKFLDMPSSRPRLIVVKCSSTNPLTAKAELEIDLKKAGIDQPDIHVSGIGDNFVLAVKTHITRDHLTAVELLNKLEKYSITQELWLTPELEIQVEELRRQYQ